jgi:hypothetical protein
MAQVGILMCLQSGLNRWMRLQARCITWAKGTVRFQKFTSRDIGDIASVSGDSTNESESLAIIFMTTPGAFNSLSAARTRAVQVAHTKQEARYVVRESGEFFVATDEDLDTFFMGIAQNNILFCTEDYF